MTQEPTVRHAGVTAIFPAGSAFAQCHASTLVALPDGGFLAAWFAGTAETNPDTAIWCAEQRAGVWSAPRVLAKISAEAHWNPVLFVAPDQVLHLWFKTGVDCARWRTWHTTSPDFGQTWATPAPFLVEDALARGPVRCPPIVTPDGIWLAGASEEQLRAMDGREWWPFIDRSSDGGRTWLAVPLALEAAAPAGKGGIQPTLWASPEGVHCLLRTGLGRIYRSDSRDGGRTWCPAYATELANNNSGIVLTQLPDGRLALLWNPVAGDWAARTPLRLSLSNDNGHTWTTHADLVTGPGEFSYPALIPTADGVAATWTDCRTTIAFWSGAV
jgi:predicted neuraminidase